MSSKIRSLLVNEALQYVDGPLPVRCVCPVCLGGSDHEECQTVWDGDDGNVYTKCHRSTCEAGTYLVKGSITTLAEREASRGKDTTSMRKPSQHKEGYPLSQREWDQLQIRYNFYFTPEYTSQLIQSYRRQGLLFPMYDVDGEQRGCILKPYDDSLPKSLTYKDEGYDGMSWYLTADHLLTKHIILVEDVISAIACMQCGFSAISLNGTLLNRERVDLIRKYKRTLYLCLDADATSKAIQYAIYLGSQCTIKVNRLDADFKDMTREQAVATLHAICG